MIQFEISKSSRVSAAISFAKDRSSNTERKEKRNLQRMDCTVKKLGGFSFVMIRKIK